MTDALRAMIMRRTLAPGERVLEVALAETLGVSRTPVRAALTALSQEGLLVYRPQRGYLVRDFSLEDVVGAYRVRANLEGLACKIVAENGLRPDTDAVLARALEQGDAILRGGVLRDEDNAPWRTMNNSFHMAILSDCGNASLIDATQRTLSLPFVGSRVVHWHDYHAISTSHFLHHAILKAIRRREPDRAEALMREHIWAAAEIIEAHYESMTAHA